MASSSIDSQVVNPMQPRLGLAVQTQQQPTAVPKERLIEAIKLAWDTRCSNIKLTDQEKRHFEAHACNDLPKYLAKIKAACEGNNAQTRVINAIQWFEPLFKLMELFVPAAKALSSAYPNPTSVILGGVVGILSITTRLVQYQTLTLQWLDYMGSKARIVMVYEGDLYGNEMAVQRALVDVYVDLISFCAKAFRITPKENSNIKAKVKGFKMTLFRDFQTFLGEEARRFENHLNILEHTKSVCDSTRLKAILDERAEDRDNLSRLVTQQQGFFKGQIDLYTKTEQDLRDQEKRKENIVRKEKALRWLSPLEFRNTLDEKCDQHLPGTGDWLLQSDKYMSWKHDEESKLLWINGKPGCGKSILAARLYQDLILLKEPDIALAYAFCRKADQFSQNTETILGALAKQINQEQEDIDSVLMKEFSAYDKSDKPSRRTVRDVLKSILSSHRKGFLLVDALDELAPTSSEAVAEELLSLVQDESSPPIKVVIFSRRDQLEKQLRNETQIRPDLGNNEDDLKAYIEDKFADENDLDDNRQIREKVIDKAQGMFLFVDLLSKNLQKAGWSLKMKLDKINRLPPNLAGIYDEIMDDIGRQEPEQKAIAFLVLTWVTHAEQALDKFQILEAVADYDGVTTLEELKASKLRNAEELVSICMNLVYIDKNDSIRLCHDSVRGYLEESRSDESKTLSEYRVHKEDAHQTIAKICLRYLLLEDFDAGPVKRLNKLAEMASKSPLLKYAACFWGAHVRTSSAIDLESLIMSLVSSPDRRELSLQVLLYLRTGDYDLWDYAGTTNELHLLAVFGLKEIAQRLEKAPALSRQADGSGSIPLDYAMRAGQHEMSSWLLEVASQGQALAVEVSQRIPTIFYYGARRGWVDILRVLVRENVAVVNSRIGPDGSTGLVRVCEAGDLEAAALLIENGADVNMQDESGDTPLIVASFFQHVQVVELLLRHKAIPNCFDAFGNGPLHYAAETKNASLVKLLLENGADPQTKSTTADHQTPLHIASEVQALKVIRAIHNVDANLDAKSKQGCTALHIAAWHNSADAAELLLDLGIEKNAVDNDKQTALFVAATEGHLDTVKVLLDKNCDVSLPNRAGDTAVHAAASCGKVAVLRAILKKQPTTRWKSLLNCPNAIKETALHAAVTDQSLGMVNQIIAFGGDPRAEGVLDSSPLHYAAHFDRRSLISVLLEKTRNPNPRNKNKDTPLHFAARAGHHAFIVKFFKECANLKLHIDIDAQNDNEATALNVVLGKKTERSEDIAKYLLQKKASSLREDDGNYPVHLASWNGFDKIVSTLLSHEGCTKKGFFGRTALLFAASQGHLKTVKLLLESGPALMGTMNTADDNLATPLFAALRSEHFEVANYLLDMKADHTVQDDSGNTLLHTAARVDDLPMVQRLLRLGCDGSARNKFAETPFLIAVRAESEAIIDALMEAGFVSLDDVSNCGDDCISIAASRGSMEMLQKLDQYRPRYQVVDIFGRNAVFQAAEGGHSEVMDFLKQRNENLALPDAENNTPLFEAADGGYLETVRYLIQKGVSNVDFCNTSGSTPLMAAARGGKTRTISYLLQHGADPERRNALGLSALDYARSHIPSLKEMHKAGAFLVEDLHTRGEFLTGTIRRCCKDLLEDNSTYSPDKAFYHRLTLLGDLHTALRMAGDIDAAKTCLLELYWPPDSFGISVSFGCDLCGRRNFPGQKFLCQSCYPATVLCKGCHADYVAADCTTPEAISELNKLEATIQPMREVLAGLSLVLVARVLRYFKVCHNWFTERLESYQDWERRFNSNSTTKYNYLDRPGYDFLQMVSKMRTLLDDFAISSEADTKITDKIAKLKKKHRIHDRTLRASKEISLFNCDNHVFLDVTPEERTAAMAESKDVDSVTGRVTNAFLRKTLEKHAAASTLQTNSSDPAPSEETSETPERNPTDHDPLPIEKAESTKPQGLIRLGNMSDRISAHEETLKKARRSSTLMVAGTQDKDQQVKGPRPPARATSLPLSPSTSREARSKSSNPASKVPTAVDLANARVKDFMSEAITLVRSFLGAIDSTPQHDRSPEVAPQTQETLASPQQEPSKSIILPILLGNSAQELTGEPESIEQQPDPAGLPNQTTTATAPETTDSNEEAIESQVVAGVTRDLRLLYLLMHDNQEDEEDMGIWKWALLATNVVDDDFLDYYIFAAKARVVAAAQEQSEAEDEHGESQKRRVGEGDDEDEDEDDDFPELEDEDERSDNEAEEEAEEGNAGGAREDGK